MSKAVDLLALMFLLACFEKFLTSQALTWSSVALRRHHRQYRIVSRALSGEAEPDIDLGAECWRDKDSVDEASVSMLQDAIEALNAGTLSRQQFEIMVRQEEEAATQRGQKVAEEQAEANAAEMEKFIFASAAGMGSLGGLIGATMDATLMSGGAPWTSPISAALLGVAAYTAAAQEGRLAASFRSVIGGTSLSVAEAVGGATNDIKVGAARKVDETLALIVERAKQQGLSTTVAVLDEAKKTLNVLPVGYQEMEVKSVAKDDEIDVEKRKLYFQVLERQLSELQREKQEISGGDAVSNELVLPFISALAEEISIPKLLQLSEGTDASAVKKSLRETAMDPTLLSSVSSQKDATVASYRRKKRQRLSKMEAQNDDAAMLDPKEQFFSLFTRLGASRDDQKKGTLPPKITTTIPDNKKGMIRLPKRKAKEGPSR